MLEVVNDRSSLFIVHKDRILLSFIENITVSVTCVFATLINRK